jgi:hypothetical protein
MCVESAAGRGLIRSQDSKTVLTTPVGPPPAILSGDSAIILVSTGDRFPQRGWCLMKNRTLLLLFGALALALAVSAVIISRKARSDDDAASLKGCAEMIASGLRRIAPTASRPSSFLAQLAA